MARREIEPVGKDKHGDEAHPAFGMIGASRVSHSPPGKVLFDSDVKHQHYVVLRIGPATRKRDLNRDWIHGGTRQIIEVAMSESQWASMISSMNTSGVPCTLEWTEKDGQLPGLDFDSRLELSHKETRAAADRAFQAIKDARDAYAEKKSAANLRALHFAIENAPANIEFAAKSLTEHAEDVVNHARADIEAMIVSKARALGLDPTDLGPLGLEGGGAPKELED